MQEEDQHNLILQARLAALEWGFSLSLFREARLQKNPKQWLLELESTTDIVAPWSTMKEHLRRELTEQQEELFGAYFEIYLHLLFSNAATLLPDDEGAEEPSS